ncbi:efflux RND transporter periplasmic adaptor subunit [Gallaecimonas kandeliae]|uniref:efflux RND transporter periplasmic adaptor subunit n=1 Tax=Gallaecimonas kandeliae TaxID=3029055 RepID=UPI0026491B02|nr:efflux RND transporter periplasmic adaptor subunit [Gallaecimonas kandeliae]WKE64268.1 efflux RND transporter periplasmic adaptor subunit [Gallaecimonas kandeliae]
MKGLWLLGALALPVLATELTLEPQPLADQLVLQGLVEATNQATVSAQTSGRVEQVLADVGDEVPAGAVILTITSVEQHQALDQAQAAEAAAQATLLSAQQDWQRVSDLVGRKLLPVAEKDKARAALDNAKAALKAASAAAKRASEQLSYTAIRAPYGGVVSQRLVEPGELVQPGTPLMTGFDPRSMRIHVDLPASLAEGAGHYHWARVGELTPKSFLLFPTADSLSGTVRLRLVLPDDAKLLPGQWQQVRVQVGEHQGLLLPKAAVQHQGELSLVRMQNGDWRAVRLGQSRDGQVEVLSGLKAGEVIQYD